MNHLNLIVYGVRPFAALLLVGSSLVVGASLIGLVVAIMTYLFAGGETSHIAAWSAQKKSVLLLGGATGAVLGVILAVSLLRRYWARLWAGF